MSTEENTGRVTNAALGEKIDTVSDTVIEVKTLVERALSDISDHELRIRVLEKTQPDRAGERLEALEKAMPDDAKVRLTALERFNWKIVGAYAAVMAVIGVGAGLLAALIGH